MRRVQKKIRDESGISILIALIVFLVSCMVSLLITDAALVAVRRVKTGGDSEQAYLAVSSAAKVFAAYLTDSKYEISVTTTTITTEPAVPGDPPDVAVEVGPPEPSPSGPLGELLEQAAVPFEDESYDPTSLYPLGNVTLTPQGEGLPACTAQIDYQRVIKDDGSSRSYLTGVITLTDSADGNSPKIYFYGELTKRLEESELPRITETSDDGETTTITDPTEEITTYSIISVSMNTKEVEPS